MSMKIINVADIEGFKLGNAENKEKGTGCTVIVCEEGAVGGVDVRGGGPATRETDLLRSENTVNSVNAVILSGGSAFGLEAASGVMRELSSRGVGFDVGTGITVPIVCGASLYDLAVGDPTAFPDVNMGAVAVQNAYEGLFSHGNHGAGTGATVGKYLGHERAMKTGLGTFACGDDYVEVGAIVAVNACGDVYNGPGNIIAGLRSEDGESIYGTIKTLKGMVHGNAGIVDDNTSFINKSDIEEALKAAEEAAEAEEPVPVYEEPVAEEPIFEGPVWENPVYMEPQEESREEPQAEESSWDMPIYDEPQEETWEQPAPEEQTWDQSQEEFYEEPVAEEPGWEAPPEESWEQPQEEFFEEPAAEEPAWEEPVYEEPQEEVFEEPVNEEPVAEEPVAEEPVPEPEPEKPKELSLEEMGYTIAFNTTIGCLITNAALTKSQANKLASILHDAYARAIKPVHGTLDGDTIFVLAAGKQQVNFDAFAALATDVMQYAVIDGATSAKGAYGLPSARDMKKPEND